MTPCCFEVFPQKFIVHVVFLGGAIQATEQMEKRTRAAILAWAFVIQDYNGTAHPVRKHLDEDSFLTRGCPAYARVSCYA